MEDIYVIGFQLKVAICRKFVELIFLTSVYLEG